MQKKLSYSVTVMVIPTHDGYSHVKPCGLLTWLTVDDCCGLGA
jgi:hypothetical protein